MSELIDTYITDVEAGQATLNYLYQDRSAEGRELTVDSRAVHIVIGAQDNGVAVVWDRGEIVSAPVRSVGYVPMGSVV